MGCRDNRMSEVVAEGRGPVRIKHFLACMCCRQSPWRVHQAPGETEPARPAHPLWQPLKPDNASPAWSVAVQPVYLTGKPATRLVPDEWQSPRQRSAVRERSQRRSPISRRILSTASPIWLASTMPHRCRKYRCLFFGTGTGCRSAVCSRRSRVELVKCMSKTTALQSSSLGAGVADATVLFDDAAGTCASQPSPLQRSRIFAHHRHCS